jgi:septal ring factor EnvC (AmiA/AmiB activator)
MTDLDRNEINPWNTPLPIDGPGTRIDRFEPDPNELAPTTELHPWAIDESIAPTTPAPPEWPAAAPTQPWVPPITPDPMAPPMTAKRRLYARIAIGIALAMLLAGTVSGWATARQQAATADKWRKSDLIEVAANQRLTTTLAGARTTITSLNGQVTTLQSHVTDLTGQVATGQQQLAASQVQLAAVANQKAKVQDQNAVLNNLVGAAGKVSSMLQTCVTDSNSVWSQLLGDINNGTILSDTTLDGNIATVTTECNAAETANHQLQTVIASTTAGQ